MSSSKIENYPGWELALDKKLGKGQERDLTGPKLGMKQCLHEDWRDCELLEPRLA